MKASCLLILPVRTLACLSLLVAVPAHAQNAESILQRCRDAYADMKSYSDSGTILYEYGSSSVDKHTFSTSFKRSPRGFRLDFHKEGGDRYVIWADPESFHTWWKATGQQTDYPNPNNLPAFSLSGPSTSGVALKIPTLLYGKSLAAAMLNLHDPVLDGTEPVDGHRCHRVSGRAGDSYSASGKEVNIHKTTVWIDADSFLVRKMLEVWDPLPGQRNRMTTLFQAQQDPALDDASFKVVLGEK